MKSVNIHEAKTHFSKLVDRLLIAQAAVEDLAIVTADTQFDSYPIPVVHC